MKMVKGKANDSDGHSVTSLPRSEMLYPISLMTNPSATGRLTLNDGPCRTWSSELIRCPTTDSRPFTRYEFFYSDIDRPWFNYDWFDADLACRGISPESNFSRRDWIFIRGDSLRRPRRFSKRFIKQELRKLEEYRSTARCLQHTGLPRPEGFPFEVLRPIKYGDNVTAFNSQIGALDRGVVVSYDLGRCAYFVSFNGRPSTLCPDTAVASHGTPLLLLDCEPIVVNDTAIESDSFRPKQDMDVDFSESNGEDYDVVVTEQNGLTS